VLKGHRFNATVTLFWLLIDKETIVIERKYINFANRGLTNCCSIFNALKYYKEFSFNSAKSSDFVTRTVSIPTRSYEHEDKFEVKTAKSIWKLPVLQSGVIQYFKFSFHEMPL
jgi:hypothetical protein